MTIPSRILRAELAALTWAHPEATAQSPMLVAHDGPEYAEHSALLTLLGPQITNHFAFLEGELHKRECLAKTRRRYILPVRFAQPEISLYPCRGIFCRDTYSRNSVSVIGIRRCRHGA